jgi:tetratricopeptide (TPR) repeat protein
VTPSRPPETNASPPDPGAAGTLDELIEALRSLKSWAGEPSYEVITDRVNAAWTATGRPERELARRGTVVDCFKTGRRRLNADLVVAVVQALNPDVGYVAQWAQSLRVVGGETRAAAQVRVQDSLPGDLIEFTGRDVELDRLREILLRASVTGGPVAISAIEGMAGVGKTRLAIHAAHLLARERPFDQVLFVNLRGFHPDPAQPPADPAAVLDGFLRLLGVPGQQIPHDLGDRAARYRELLTGRRALVVLDNAVDEAQVEPLLPGAAGCLTLITSRRRLTGLGAALHLAVDVFTPDESLEFLKRTVPDVAIGDDPTALVRVAQRCGHLPLALGLVAGHMLAKPGWTVTDHAVRLDERHADRRLEGGVELALSLSYQHLAPERRALLRLLGTHPGQDADAYAAAALAGTDLDTVRGHLAQLCTDHLLQETPPGRYLMHDLVRAYAGDRAVDEDRPAARRDAMTRLFDHYLHTAAAAMAILYPAEQHRRPSVEPARSPAPALGDEAGALAWLDAERATLVAVSAYATRNGWPDHAVRLAAVLYSYLDNGGHPAEALAVHANARDAARQSGDRAGEAGALTHLGVGYWQLGHLDTAVEHLQQARALFHASGDGVGEARTVGNLGIVYFRMSQYEAAADHHRQALALFAAAGDRVGEANTLTNLGDVQVWLGRYEEAAQNHERALLLFRDLGHRGGEATALTNLGDAQLRMGRFESAAEQHRQALALFTELGEQYGQTCTLNSLGEALAGLGRPAGARERFTAALGIANEIGEQAEQARAHSGLALSYQAAGDGRRAATHWRSALARYDELGVPEADEVRARLAAL